MSILAARDGACCVTLYPVKQCPEIARTFVRHRLLGFDVTLERVDDGCLIASELVTNVLRHVPGVEKFYLYLGAGRDNRPLLEVWDPSVEVPKVVALPEVEFGRGLHIVSALSVRWGYYFIDPDRGGGKVVWASLL